MMAHLGYQLTLLALQLMYGTSTLLRSRFFASLLASFVLFSFFALICSILTSASFPLALFGFVDRQPLPDSLDLRSDA